MSEGRDAIVSAQALIRPASGERLSGDVAITVETLDRYRPSPQDVEAAREAFRAAGFEVGELVGISFSVTAPVSRFERFFAARLRVRPDGAVEVGSGGLELPLTALPPALAGRLVAVTFTPPADLHGPKAGLMI
jgi:hypothetical protein